jgi:hypothetical protein
MVLISIEQITEQVSKTGRSYYSFWVRLNFNGRAISSGGWKYFPDKQTLSSPSQGKEGGRFFNTTKLNPQMYNDILAVAARTFENAVSADETVAAA